MIQTLTPNSRFPFFISLFLFLSLFSRSDYVDLDKWLLDMETDSFGIDTSAGTRCVLYVQHIHQLVHTNACAFLYQTHAHAHPSIHLHTPNIHYHTYILTFTQTHFHALSTTLAHILSHTLMHRKAYMYPNPINSGKSHGNSGRKSNSRAKRQRTEDYLDGPGGTKGVWECVTSSEVVERRERAIYIYISYSLTDSLNQQLTDSFTHSFTSLSHYTLSLSFSQIP